MNKYSVLRIFQYFFDRVKRLKSYGNIHIHLDLIAGLPGEDLASFRKSFNETYALTPDMLQLGFLKLLKGSGLREDAKKYGIVYSSFAPYEVISTPQMSAQDLLLLKKCERGLEYYNTKRYACSLKYAIIKIAPFDFYTTFGERLFQLKGALNQTEQTRELFRCGLDAGFPLNEWQEIVRYDYLHHDKQNEYMEEIGYLENPAAKRRLQEMRKIYPHLGRYCHVEYFAFDVPLFITSGKKDSPPTCVLFDYLTKEAKKI